MCQASCYHTCLSVSSEFIVSNQGSYYYLHFSSDKIESKELESLGNWSQSYKTYL